MLKKLSEWVIGKRSIQPGSLLKARLFIIFMLAIVIIASLYSPGYDWHFWGRPAAQAMLAGHSPYNITGFYNPPWALLPLLPLALMPEKVGAVVLTFLHFMCYIITAHKLGAKPVTIALFMLLPNVAMWGYGFANLDWMVVLGFILPPQIGLFLVLVKPQLGLAIAIYWLVEAWRTGRARLVISTFLPVTLAYIASFLLYGLWPLKMQLVFGQLNTSLWPMAIPIGLVLLFSALHKRKMGLAISASPFLSPYVGVHSWPIAILGLLPAQTETILAIIGLWVVNLIQNESLRQLMLDLFTK